MKLINIGFGNMVSAGRVVAVVSPDSAPVKRLVKEARERGIPKVALGHDESGTRLRFSCAKSPTLRCGVRLWRRFPSSDLPTTALNHVFRALA